MLDFNKNKLPPSMERMLLAYDDNHSPHIMCRRGPGIEHEDMGSDADDLGIPRATHVYAGGLWVYDVVPTFVEEHSEGWPNGLGHLEYDKGTWRRPTDNEWEYIKAGDLAGLFSICWSDVTSAVEWDKKVEENKT